MVKEETKEKEDPQVQLVHPEQMEDQVLLVSLEHEVDLDKEEPLVA